jgi:hypothetical protein
MTPRCLHIFPDAHSCGSPAMRNETFCYYHHPARKPLSDPYTRRARRGFTLAAPTSPDELHHALDEVISRLASNRLDTRRASLILYSLQIATGLSPGYTSQRL